MAYVHNSEPWDALFFKVERIREVTTCIEAHPLSCPVFTGSGSKVGWNGFEFKQCDVMITGVALFSGILASIWGF